MHALSPQVSRAPGLLSPALSPLFLPGSLRKLRQLWGRQRRPASAFLRDHTNLQTKRDRAKGMARMGAYLQRLGLRDERCCHEQEEEEGQAGVGLEGGSSAQNQQRPPPPQSKRPEPGLEWGHPCRVVGAPNNYQKRINCLVICSALF